MRDEGKGKGRSKNLISHPVAERDPSEKDLPSFTQKDAYPKDPALAGSNINSRGLCPRKKMELLIR